jgi:hypothetical protein
MSILNRTQLCKHGPGHESRSCLFAHGLMDIRCPRPREGTLHAWPRIHYYIGQAWDDDIIENFKTYVDVTLATDLPAWAIPAIWVYYGLPLLWQPFAGEDFGVRERLSRYTECLPRCRHLFCDKVQSRKAALIHTGVHDAICGTVPPPSQPISTLGPCARREPRSPSYSPSSRRKRWRPRRWRSRSSSRRVGRCD